MKNLETTNKKETIETTEITKGEQAMSGKFYAEKVFESFLICKVSAPSGKWMRQGKSRLTIWERKANGKLEYIGRVGTWPNTRQGTKEMESYVKLYIAQGYEYWEGDPRCR